ncbi:RNA polymerase sigma factor [Paenibacillus segetis]|uniref:ECF RNA polymerase sigma factor SigM n=1 Tax=Paenibacillus segetis TaxID=1325360 RepID=A0ABQ1YBJ0_9BACL|nr:sigma-70 family RNA polymerase sigma factor [Paenibacillus segetis]GGH19227.1 ECF RNA polymerase sigma factor SigM [Paenibacillus segetis]
MKTKGIDQIYRVYSNDVYRYLLYLGRNHHTAEDLTQEVFCRALKHVELLDGKRTKAWLLRVAHNAYIDRVRKESRSSIHDQEYFYDFASEDTPESCMVRQENRKELYGMLSMLQPNQQHAVLLYDVHGFSYQESADLMGITLSHFKIILYRARQKLRQFSESA